VRKSKPNVLHCSILNMLCVKLQNNLRNKYSFVIIISYITIISWNNISYYFSSKSMIINLFFWTNQIKKVSRCRISVKKVSRSRASDKKVSRCREVNIKWFSLLYAQGHPIVFPFYCYGLPKNYSHIEKHEAFCICFYNMCMSRMGVHAIQGETYLHIRVILTTSRHFPVRNVTLCQFPVTKKDRKLARYFFAWSENPLFMRFLGFTI